MIELDCYRRARTTKAYYSSASEKWEELVFPSSVSLKVLFISNFALNSDPLTSNHATSSHKPFTLDSSTVYAMELFLSSTKRTTTTTVKLTTKEWPCCSL